MEDPCRLGSNEGTVDGVVGIKQHGTYHAHIVVNIYLCQNGIQATIQIQHCPKIIVTAFLILHFSPS